MDQELIDKYNLRLVVEPKYNGSTIRVLRHLDNDTECLIHRTNVKYEKLAVNIDNAIKQAAIICQIRDVSDEAEKLLKAKAGILFEHAGFLADLSSWLHAVSDEVEPFTESLGCSGQE